MTTTRTILPLLLAIGAAFPAEMRSNLLADPGATPPKAAVPDDIKLARMYRKQQKKHHKKNRRSR